MAAFEGMHTKPQAKEIEPVLGCFPTLEEAFGVQVGLDDAVDGFGGTTGADSVDRELVQIRLRS